MKKIVFLLFLFVSGIKSFSQQQYFMYLQADDQNPFYAKISNKMYSSSESGYMIIPKLGDSSFDITIGFAKNAFPEQRFPLAVNKKDRGYQLKNLGDKGWALINLQTMAVIQNTAQAKKTENAFAGVKKTDAFSELLANVVNDSAVLYTPVKASPVVTEPEKTPVVTKQIDKQAADTESMTKTLTTVKPENNLPVEKKDSTKAIASTANTNVKNEKDSPALINPVSPPTAVKEKKQTESGTTKPVLEKPFITRIEEKKTAGMYQATYLELYTLTTDTIRISIPLDDSSAKNLTESPAKPVEPVIEQKVARNDQKVTTVSNPDSLASEKKVLLITNSDCKSFATDYDVDKFRIKLLDDKTIDNKLSSSKKYFKSKCYSVSQVKALSELYPSDETKYQFFELAFPYVSDTSNFYLLEEMIQNNLYRKKFDVLIHR